MPYLHNAQAIAKSLGGRRSGKGWVARCPAHDYQNPSLSLKDIDDRLLWHCHAGCAQSEVQKALERRGLLNRAPRREDLHVSSNNLERAKKIFDESIPAHGTLAEKYLKTRGIVETPDAVRFHPSLQHSSGERFPAMLVFPTNPRNGVQSGGVHRTFLAYDGSGKAPIANPKLSLGPCKGCAVPLGLEGTIGHVLIGEGIETTLSAVQATGLFGYAALSAGNLETLELPPHFHTVTILADRDASGRGEEAATKAALRLSLQGFSVAIALPSSEGDFNDVLLGKAR